MRNRVTQRQVRDRVAARQDFELTTKSLFSLLSHGEGKDNSTTQRYGVFSYHRGWPVLIYEWQPGAENDGVWYENIEKVSVTTSKHLSIARPHNIKTTPMPREDMLVLWSLGICGVMRVQAERQAHALDISHV